MKNLRDIVSRSDVQIQKIILSKSPDLICRNVFCEKVTFPCEYW